MLVEFLAGGRVTIQAVHVLVWRQPVARLGSWWRRRRHGNIAGKEANESLFSMAII